jgi:2,5-diamino-6-(ribosylamino)-4(3H)-pyrimidinone 5'-phosphate reductase
MDKPTVICHMMATIDGKITSGTDVDILDNFFDLYTKTEDQLNGDSWMCGRVTMEMFAKGEKIELVQGENTNNFTDFLENKSDKGYFIGVDTRGLLRWNTNTIKLSNYEHPLPIVIVVTKETPGTYLDYLKELKINYIIGGDDSIVWEEVMKKLKTDLNINRLLLEGGGRINGSILDANLIDEISLMIVPTVLNRSAAPTIFENDTDKVDVKNFKLISINQIEKDCVWLRYERYSN